jgi:hypothetical protein
MVFEKKKNPLFQLMFSIAIYVRDAAVAGSNLAPSNPIARKSNFDNAESNRRSKSLAYAARFGSRLGAGDLKLWLTLRWGSIDARVLTLAPSIEDARAKSSHSLA